MTNDSNPHRRMLTVLMTAGALISSASSAQQAQTVPVPAAPAAQASPPPIVVHIPDSNGVTDRAADSTQSRPVGDTNSPTQVNPEAAEQAAAEQAELRAERAGRSAQRRAPTPRPALQRPAARATSAPTAAAAPAPGPAATPVPEVTPALTPTATPVADASPTRMATAATTDDVAATRETTGTRTGGFPMWLLIALGVIVVAGLAIFLLRRRSDDNHPVEEPVAHAAAEPMVEPAPYVAPVAAPMGPPVVAAEPTRPLEAAEAVEPTLAENATVETADDQDVAALTAAAPVAGRPWLEFALRPIRAGTNVDEVVVEIELTVGNAGEVSAQDVRITASMVPDGAEVTRLLADDAPADTGIDAISIAAGEGTRVDTTLALLRTMLVGDTFAPVVIADARYRLPDGGQGRTAAAFSIGRDAGSDRLVPIDLGETVMHEDVEARLYRAPDHA